MTPAAARAALERMTAAATAPTLEADEITALLAAARRVDAHGIAPDAYDAWAAQTAYALAAAVVPPVRNGHVYRVTTAGTSGTSRNVLRLPDASAGDSI